MKKAVAILVSIIALAAIVIVAFFGVSEATIVESVYVETLTLNSQVAKIESWDPAGTDLPKRRVFTDFKKESIDADGHPYMAILFDADITPEKAKGNALKWTGHGDSARCRLEDSKYGLLYVTKIDDDAPATYFVVTCAAADGGKSENNSDSIFVVVKFPKGGNQ
jgi:hypothetical protein